MAYKIISTEVPLEDAESDEWDYSDIILFGHLANH